jgi:transposase
MARRQRRNHAGEFKARVALAAIRGDKTLSEVAEQFEVHPHQVTEWKRQLLERAGEVFDGPRRKDEPAVDVKVLHAKIGQLTLENDFLEGALTKAGMLSAKR